MTKRQPKTTEEAEPLDLVDAEEPLHDEGEPGDLEEAATPEELLRREVEDMRLLAQRTQAELENYRKRVERERAETLKYATIEIVREILPVLDNLERAVEAAETNGPARDDDLLLQGVAIVQKQFRDTLVRQGLEEVEARGRLFDPHVHEAVGRVETEDSEDGTVVEVFQKGYRFKDRLLRPAMVTVAQRSDGGSQGSEGEGE